MRTLDPSAKFDLKAPSPRMGLHGERMMVSIAQEAGHCCCGQSRAGSSIRPIPKFPVESGQQRLGIIACCVGSSRYATIFTG